MDREGGFIKLHRQLLSSPVWIALRGDQRAVLVEILFRANWKALPAAWHGRVYEVGRGELSHTLATLAEGAGVTVKVVRSTIEALLRDHGNGAFLSERYPISGTGPGTGPRVLKVLNYDKFQDVPDEKGHGVGHGPGTDRAQREEGEEGEEEDHGPPKAQVALLPAPPPSSPFGRFVAENWPDVTDPDRLWRRLRDTHPRLDLLAEARKALAWEAANTRKKKRDHSRFLTNWMANARPALAAVPAIPRRREVLDVTPEGKVIYGDEA